MRIYSAILVCLFLIGCGAKPTAQQAWQDIQQNRLNEALRTTPPVHNGWYQQCPAAIDLLHEVNSLRESQNLTALIPDPALTYAAMNHAGDMVSRDYFAHDSLEGTSFSQRAYQAGYQRFVRGEVLSNAVSAERAVMLWQQSVRHNEIITQSDINFAGSGCEQKSGGGYYWVLVTGT